MQLIQAFFREAPNRVQQYDYGTRTDNQPDYVGHNKFGAADSDDGWLIFHYTYNASGAVTKIESTEGIWSIRDEYFS